MIGTTIGHYRLVKRLGAGGMGVVYRAEDVVLRRPVALKFLPPEIVGDPERRARFHREARLAAALNHPNTCTVYEVGQVGAIDGGMAADEPLIPIGTPFIAMEFVEGETLAARLATAGRLPAHDALDLAAQAAAGLAEAHANGIVHRDLKPQNVMVTPAGRVKILDFGLAKPFAVIPRPDVEPATSEMFSTDLGEGILVGTVAYMAPEQALRQPVDPRSDVFAFGIMLYELVTGQRPFRGTTASAIVVKILEAEPAPLPSWATDVPPAVVQIIQRCLQKRPEDRYQKARDLEADLSQLARRFSAEPCSFSTAPRLSSAGDDLTTLDRVVRRLLKQRRSGRSTPLVDAAFDLESPTVRPAGYTPVSAAGPGAATSRAGSISRMLRAHSRTLIAGALALLVEIRARLRRHGGRLLVSFRRLYLR